MQIRLGRNALYQFIMMLAIVLFVLLWAGSELVGNQPAQAETTIQVTANSYDEKSSNDDICTLREAIIAANSDKKSGNRKNECPAGSGADTIILPAGTYVLTRTDNGQEDSSTTGDLDITTDLTIQGAGARSTVIIASNITDRALHVLAGKVTISGVTIVGGNTKRDGGGLLNLSPDLHLIDVSIEDSTAEGNGGGIYNEGTLTITGSTLSGNRSTAGSGAGIYNIGSLSMVNSTVSGNIAAGNGGGILNLGSSATISFSTIAYNQSTGGTGGGISADNSIVLNSVLIAGNQAVSGSETSGTISGASSHNLIGLTGANIGPLADNGGPTDTHALLEGSLAVEGGDNASAPAVDQRGIDRPQYQLPDIGAYELESADFVVNSTADTNDGTCNSANCTLREAIAFANSAPYSSIPVPISFAIPEAEGNVITLTSPLPEINHAVNLDGTNQSSQAADKRVTLNIAKKGAGIVLNTDNSTLTNIVITNSAGDGLAVNGDSNLITAVDVLTSDRNGVVIVGNDNALADSLISNNGGDQSACLASAGDGIKVQGSTNSISNNRVITNHGNGIHIATGGANTIDLNKIQYNTLSGILLAGSGSDIVTKNDISYNGNACLSPDPNGSGVPQSGNGITATSGSHTIDDNDITFNGGSGIYLSGPGEPDAINNTVTNNRIKNNAGDGITIDSGYNDVSNNTIVNNGGNGITVLNLPQNTNNGLLGNDINNNTGLAIDLGGDGQITPNDDGDGDLGANNIQNYPVLFRATPILEADGWHLLIDGRLNSAANQLYEIQFFAGAGSSCSVGDQFLLNTTALQVQTDGFGNVYFSHLSDPLPTSLVPVPNPNVSGELQWHEVFVSALATEVASAGLPGNTSELGSCLPGSPGNDSWVTAFRIQPGFSPSFARAEHVIALPGQSRWYKFSVIPGSRVMVTLTDLPKDYNLTVYKDINQSFSDLISEDAVETLTRLGAEFAPEAFSSDAFSHDTFSPDSFSPEAFSPEAFSPEAFSPEAFSPEAFSPEAFSPEAFSPEAFSPEAFSPEAFSPEAFSPEAFSPEAFSPEAFSPEAFSAAQSTSLIAVSAFQGTAGEGVIVNTWNNSGDFYVRVRGSNGAFDPYETFRLEVEVLGQNCSDVQPLPSHTPAATAGNYETIILWDSSRMVGDTELLGAKLAELATKPPVNGVVVDLKSKALDADANVKLANAQADAHRLCPYAKNLVADSIKAVIDAYWDANPGLQYVVLVGNDDVIPFYRYPDNAMLANESNYYPPVQENTASQASLRLGYVLSQDAYGAEGVITLKNSTLPLPKLGVGRLVETADDVIGLLDYYLATFNSGASDRVVNGVLTPETSLVTGYDFLEDAAWAVELELREGITRSDPTYLIAPYNISPLDPASWTADDLRSVLLNSGRNDLVYLAGHFSASGTLAADYRTRVTAQELVDSAVDMSNTIVFSAGCHSGYNIVDYHGIPNITQEPDWAQAFARKGATLIAGTGYQYGDTDFIEYSERLYLEFARELRTGEGPVSIGQALVTAKNTYIAETPSLLGIHEKALLEATIFGLPMMQVNMDGQRIPRTSDVSIIENFPETSVSSNPGAELGLKTVDVNIPVNLTQQFETLTYITGTKEIQATYLEGTEGIVTNPAQPTLPLLIRNVSAPDNTDYVLRGIGFRGGTYIYARDYDGTYDVIPFTGAPTTEIRGVHAPFVTDVYFPVQPWGVNYYDALTDTGSGATRLVLTPAQFKSTAPDPLTGSMRQFTSMDFRLYYSNNFSTYAGSDDQSKVAFSVAPSIVTVSSEIVDTEVVFAIDVVGNPSAGVQDVWITWTNIANQTGGSWQLLELEQNGDISSRWEGILDLSGQEPSNIRFMVQAANGVGLVSLATNLGAYYTPGNIAPSARTTTVTLNETNPRSAAYGTKIDVRATLDIPGLTPVAEGETCPDEDPFYGNVISFKLGALTRQGITNCQGIAKVSIPMLSLPGDYRLLASFAGAGNLLADSDAQDFSIGKQQTELTVTTDPAETDGALALATLRDFDGRPLSEKTVFVVVFADDGYYSTALITDYVGQVRLETVPFPLGTYTVAFYFGTEGTDFIILYDENGVPQSITQPDERYLPAEVSTKRTTVTLDVSNPNSAQYLDTVNIVATLAADGMACSELSGKDIVFTLGTQTVSANTVDDCNAEATISLTDLPGTYVLGASFAGAGNLLASTGVADFTIAKLTASLALETDPSLNGGAIVRAELTDQYSTPLSGVTVYVNIFGIEDSVSTTLLTDNAGRVSLTSVPFPVGSYSVDFYTLGEDNIHEPTSASALRSFITLDANNPANALYGTSVTFSATIAVNGLACSELSGKDIVFTLGTQTVQENTGDDCSAQVTFSLSDQPGAYQLEASFAGAGNLLASTGAAAFTIDKLTTSLTLDTDPVLTGGALVLATLQDQYGSPLSGASLQVNFSGTEGSDSTTLTTDAAGHASLDSIPFSVGDYTVEFSFSGDDYHKPVSASTSIRLNSPPVCTGAYPDPSTVWPLNKEFEPIQIMGVEDPDGDGIRIVIDSIYQDEPFGYNGNDPDGDGIGTSTALVRAERDGNGDGRVYHIYFTATDEKASCQGEVVLATIAHDKNSESTNIDGGACYNSVDGTPNPDPTACRIP